MMNFSQKGECLGFLNIDPEHSLETVTHLEPIDLVPEFIWILPGNLLTGNLPLNLLQPPVQVLQVLPGLPVLFLHRLLQ